MMKISALFNLQKLGVLTSTSLASIAVLSFNHLVLAQQACVMTKAGNVVCGTLVPDRSNTASSGQSLSPIEANGFKFELQSCLRSGSNVSCNLLITKIEDRTGDSNGLFELYGKADSPPSRVITVSGEEFVSPMLQLGDQQGSWARTNLVAGVPIKAVLNFEVPPQISKLALLELGYAFYRDGQGQNKRTAQFRNVTIESK